MHTVNVSTRPNRSAIWGAPEAANAERLVEMLNTRTVGAQLLVRDEYGTSVMTRTASGWETSFQPREAN